MLECLRCRVRITHRRLTVCLTLPVTVHILYLARNGPMNEKLIEGPFRGL